MSRETEKIPLGERLTGAALVAPIRLARLLPYRWRIPFAAWLTTRVLRAFASAASTLIRNGRAIARYSATGNDMKNPFNRCE